MRSDAHAVPSGYRQPAQARLFGSGGLVILLLATALMLTIRLIPPPATAIDVGREATVVELIPAETSADLPAQPDAREPVAAPIPAQQLTVPDALVPLPEAAAPAVPAAPSPQPPVGIALPAIIASPAPAAVTQPTTNPARPAATAGGSASAAADWRARLLGHLKRYRRYPRQAEAARQQGIARVAITLRRSGEVVGVELVRGSGYPLLDLEARATVQRASPLPAPDEAVPGDPVTVEVPIDFALRR